MLNVEYNISINPHILHADLGKSSIVHLHIIPQNLTTELYHEAMDWSRDVPIGGRHCDEPMKERVMSNA